MLISFGIILFYCQDQKVENFYQNINTDTDRSLSTYNGVYMIGSHNSAHSNALIASPYDTNISKINYPFNL